MIARVSAAAVLTPLVACSLLRETLKRSSPGSSRRAGPTPTPFSRAFVVPDATQTRALKRSLPRSYVAWRFDGLDATAGRSSGQARLLLSDSGPYLLFYIRISVSRAVVLASQAGTGGPLISPSPGAAGLKYVKKYLQSVKRLTDFVSTNRDSRSQQLYGPVDENKGRRGNRQRSSSRKSRTTIRKTRRFA